MKKVLFMISVAAVAFTSCSNESTEYVGSGPEQKEIAFMPLAQKATRAADTKQYAIDGIGFPTELNMYVAAYQVEPTPAGNFFTGTQFVYDNAGGTGASSGKWGGATPRYWPLSPCYINFLAYANVTGTAIFGDQLVPAEASASKAVITQSDNSSAQTDLMYAIGNGYVTQNATTSALTFPTKVDMQFKHAQAWMDFYVKANSPTETAITVNSITLKGARYAGTYTITHTNYDAKSGQTVAGTWSALAAAKDATVPGWSATALSTTNTQVSHGLLVVPDEDAASNDWTSFVISYTLGGKNYNYEYNAPAAPAASLSQATHYVFNITFSLHEIFVEATVADWTDATATGVGI